MPAPPDGGTPEGPAVRAGADEPAVPGDPAADEPAADELPADEHGAQPTSSDRRHDGTGDGDVDRGGDGDVGGDVDGDVGGGVDGWSGTGPDTGTVRRSRPSRSPRTHVGVPTPPSPMNAATGPTPETPGTPAGGSPSPVPDPPRRPMPPTFPSPGQPPPGVARRHGRHARPERPGAVHTPPSGYRPRHAAPDAETEQFAATPVTGPGGIGPMPLPVAPDEGEGAAPARSPAVAPVAPAAPVGSVASVGSVDGAATTADTPTAAPTTGPSAAALAAPGGTFLHTGPGVVVPPLPDGASGPGRDGFEGSDRVRVVLAERRVPTRAVRTVAEIEQQTETGELLLRNLLRAQLALGLRLGLVAVFVLGALPVLFLVLPRTGSVEIAGVTLPWLVLGLAPYPFMLALAWLYTRTAERNELDFADNVED
ncbi:hypothetical protein [Actinomycetospora aeridis]|uniref:DUF485 domain-containing protein n=1 Tax=Actinomycetospora aeridis TaxID=3129231 RepID=A0ABU8N365_9PSEU